MELGKILAPFFNTLKNQINSLSIIKHSENLLRAVFSKLPDSLGTGLKSHLRPALLESIGRKSLIWKLFGHYGFSVEYSGLDGHDQRLELCRQIPESTPLETTHFGIKEIYAFR